MYLVGGEDNTANKNGLNFMRQAWSVEKCAFRREQDLPFDFDSGRCTSMANRSKAMLCSGIQRPKACWIYDLGFVCYFLQEFHQFSNVSDRKLQNKNPLIKMAKSTALLIELYTRTLLVK